MTPNTGRSISLRRKYRDRKSTRLNSSHGYISYAVFCLKKKKKSSQDRPKDFGIFSGQSELMQLLLWYHRSYHTSGIDHHADLWRLIGRTSDRIRLYDVQ